MINLLFTLKFLIEKCCVVRNQTLSIAPALDYTQWWANRRSQKRPLERFPKMVLEVKSKDVRSPRKAHLVNNDESDAG